MVYLYYAKCRKGCEFYTLKIIQHKGSKPFFLAERFEIVSGFAFSYDAEDYLYKHFYPEDAEMLEKLLIELSDKEIRGEQNEQEIRSI